MNEKGQNNHEKGKMWESFVSILNYTYSKKGNDEKMKKWIDFVSSSVDDLDNFFFWLSERSDVFEMDVFPSRMMLLLNRTIYYRNVILFKRFVYEIGPIYLQYLYLSPDVMDNKQIPDLLNLLFLSYPLSHDYICKSLQEPMNLFFNSVLNMKGSPLQKAYLDFVQNICFLYPELSIDLSSVSESSGLPSFSDETISKRVQSYYLKNWGGTDLKEAPPIGNYLSDSEGVFSVVADYNTITPVEIPWYSFPSPLEETILRFIHTTPEEGLVYVEKKQKDRVLFWVCPHCSCQNNLVGPCKCCQAPLPDAIKREGFTPISYMTPGFFMNNHYTIQTDRGGFPSGYVFYTEPVGNQNYFQDHLTVSLDSIFSLPSGHYISCQFPKEYNSNYYDALFASIILPDCDNGSFTILYSEVLTVSFNAKSSSLIIAANPNMVDNFKGISYRDCCCVNKGVMTLETPVDKDLFCNIHYAVLNPNKVVIQVYNNIIICKLKNPITNVTAHISRFVLCNVSGDNNKERIGVLGMIVYHYNSESKWTEIPQNAVVFSLIGSHYGRERGLRYVNEIRSCRCYLTVHSNDPNGFLSWSHFIEKENRAINNRNAFLVNEFCYFTPVCMMNPNVDCKNANNLMRFGYGPRMGSLYWKFLFSLNTMNVAFTVDMEKRNESYSIWWMTNEAIPSHHVVNTLCKSLASSLSKGNEQEELFPVPFFLEHSMLFVMMKKLDDKTMRVVYAYTLTGPDNTQNHLVIKKGIQLPIKDHFAITVELKNGSLVMMQDGKEVNYGMSTELPSDFYQQGVHFLSGFSGLYMSLYDFRFNSYNIDPPSSYVVSNSCPHLTQVAKMEVSRPNSWFSCYMRYREKPALGSTDPALANPRVIQGKGAVYSLDSTSRQYVVIGDDGNQSDLLYCRFDNDKTKNNMVSIWSNNKVTEKRISRTTDNDVSCFTNNCIQRHGKNATGIANSNNTCFQNSTLQLLYHSDELRKSIFQFYSEFKRSKCDQTTVDAMCLKELVNVLSRLQLSIRGYEFNTLLDVLQKRFEVGYQHDMNEYFDYLMNTLDNCYNQMKKVEGEETMKSVINPITFIQGKQQECVSCQCGKHKETSKEKETEFQNAYITLTSAIGPITSISFELCDYTDIPSKHFTTYTFIVDYKGKGVFMALERDPAKTPICNVVMRNDRKVPSDYIRVPSFHSYFSSQLYYQTFCPSYSHSIEKNEEDTVYTISSNQLVVDILIRAVVSNSPDVSQTNNGTFVLVDSFDNGEEEYEVYQKIVDYSIHKSMESKATIQLNAQPDLFSLLPTKFNSVASSVESTVASYVKKESDSYTLFSQQIELGRIPNTLSVFDKDNLSKMAIYCSRSLVGHVSMEDEMLPCVVCDCEIVGEGVEVTGKCWYSSSMLCVFDIIHFDEFNYKIVAEEGILSAIEIDNQWYSLQGCQEEEGIMHYGFMSSDSKFIQLSISDSNTNGKKRKIHYTHTSLKNNTPFDGVLLTYDALSFLYIPHSDLFAGCYYTFEQNDPYLPIEQSGSSVWYQKKRQIKNAVLGYIYSGYSIPYFVYKPEVHELSVASMILSSLNMQDIPSNKVCDKCSSPICKRHVITQFPEFLPVSISRTFFDTTTYSLTKDCSHITINSNLTLQGEEYVLYSIVIHLGCSFDSGHYVVYCRHSDDGGNTDAENPANIWSLFNDDTVTPYKWEEVVAQIYDYGACPYFVVYRRKCHLCKPKPCSYLPSYTDNSPSLDEFSDVVKNIDDSNEQHLCEIPNASFILRMKNKQYSS